MLCIPHNTAETTTITYAIHSPLNSRYHYYYICYAFPIKQQIPLLLHMLCIPHKTANTTIITYVIHSSEHSRNHYYYICYTFPIKQQIPILLHMLYIPHNTGSRYYDYYYICYTFLRTVSQWLIDTLNCIYNINRTINIVIMSFHLIWWIHWVTPALIYKLMTVPGVISGS